MMKDSEGEIIRGNSLSALSEPRRDTQDENHGPAPD